MKSIRINLVILLILFILHKTYLQEISHDLLYDKISSAQELSDSFQSSQIDKAESSNSSIN